MKIPVGRGEEGAKRLIAFGALARSTKLVAVFAADRQPDFDLVPVAATAGFSGVMLDTVDKSGGLLDALDLADLAHFVAAARRARLMVGSPDR